MDFLGYSVKNMSACPNTLWNVRCMEGHPLADRQRLYEGLTSGSELSPYEAFKILGLIAGERKKIPKEGVDPYEALKQSFPNSFYVRFIDLVKAHNTPQEAFTKLGLERDFAFYNVLTSENKLSAEKALDLMDVQCPACRLEIEAPPVIPELQTVTKQYVDWEEALPRGQSAAVRRTGVLTAVLPGMSKPAAKTGAAPKTSMASMFVQAARPTSDAPRYSGPQKGEQSMQDPSTAIRRYNEPYKGGERRFDTESVKAAIKRGGYNIHQLTFAYPKLEMPSLTTGGEPAPIVTVKPPTFKLPEPAPKLVLPKPSASIKASKKPAAIVEPEPEEVPEDKPKKIKKPAAKTASKEAVATSERASKETVATTEKEAPEKPSKEEETEPIEPKKKKAAGRKKTIEP